jgi:hypothetical protein
LNYQQALEEQEPERTLYLAVPADTYDTFFAIQFVEQVIERYHLKLIVYETESEVIVKWQR